MSIKVLVVDDKKDLRMLLRLYLEKWFEAEVLEAANGKHAIEVIRTEPEIKLVLLDVMMPEVDGFETASFIKEYYSDRDMKVCMLTARCDERSILKLLLKGVDDYVVKPVDEEIFEKKLRTLLFEETNDSRPPFATIQANISGVVRNLRDSEIRIVEISEYHLVIECPVSIEEGGVLLICSEELSDVLGLDASIYLKVSSCERSVKGGFTCTGRYIAQNHDLRKAIRRVSIQGQGLNDEQ